MGPAWRFAAGPPPCRLIRAPLITRIGSPSEEIRQKREEAVMCFHTGIVSHSARTRTRARNAVAGKTRERCTRTSRKDLLNCCLRCCRFSPTNWKKRANAFGRESYKCIAQRRRSKIIFSIEEKIAITFLHYCHSLISHRHSQPPPTTHPHMHTISTLHITQISRQHSKRNQAATRTTQQPDPHLDEIQRGGGGGLGG